MAKDSDNLAGSFETENAGGVLAGFLAEEDAIRPARAVAARVVGRGARSALSSSRCSPTSPRWDCGANRSPSADLTRQSQQIQSIAKESQNETRRLASAIDTLNSDRDRLYSRVTVLEQGLDSVTGAIARQNAAATSPQAARRCRPPPRPLPSAAAPRQRAEAARRAGHISGRDH